MNTLQEQQETDLRPFLDRAYSMGMRDYTDRVDVMEGMQKFKLAGATRDELIAYGNGWSRAMLRSVLRTNKIEFQEIV